MQPHEQVHRSRKRMLIDNFLGGIAWSLGVFIGSTIVVTIIVFALSKVNLVPIVGTFVANVTQDVADKNPQLVK